MLLLFWLIRAPDLCFADLFSSKIEKRDLSLPRNAVYQSGRPTPVSNVIVMDNRTTKGPSPKAGVRDRRYAIRYPFAADVELIDLETGERASGVTSDISLGGCFICTSKPLALKSRARLTLSRKGQVVKGLAVVRIVKPRIGMGIEFIDIEQPCHDLLSKWIDQLRER
jgi:PilZ domain